MNERLSRAALAYVTAAYTEHVAMPPMSPARAFQPAEASVTAQMREFVAAVVEVDGGKLAEIMNASGLLLAAAVDLLAEHDGSVSRIEHFARVADVAKSRLDAALRPLD